MVHRSQTTARFHHQVRGKTTDPVTKSNFNIFSSLPDFNDLGYTFQCGAAEAGMNPQYKKCTLSTDNGWIFHGREKDGVVDFQPVRYGLSPDGENRWKAPRINYEYPDPVDGHLGERITCRQGQNGVEDCLYASIAIKKEYLEKKQKVPILFHIHGGGFTGGSGPDFRFIIKFIIFDAEIFDL